MNEHKKKYVIPIVALVFVGALILLLGTYAYWQVTRKQTNRNLVGSACLNITFSNETGDINLEKMWPTSDADGAALTPYTFTITNTCHTAVTYQIALESLADEESENPAYLNYNYVKLKLDDGNPSIYGNSEALTNDTNESYVIRDTKQIGINTLAGHESTTHSLRLWLADNAPIEEMNKYFFSKVKIIAGQGIENDDCYAIASDGTITGYNPVCGRSATIPAIVSGIRVRNIASDAFKPVTYTYTYGFNDEFSTFEQQKNAIESYDCTGQNGTQKCKLDFSFAATGKISPAFDGNSPAADATADDVFIIIYNNDPTTPQYSSVESFARTFLTSAGQQVGIDTSTSKIYHVGDSDIPTGNISEMYYSLQYNNGQWVVINDPVGRSRATSSSGTLVINSLDLSQATYLEKIENRAFSNAPDLTDASDLPDINNIPTGLTSLTIGQHNNNIQVGGAAFAKMDLDSLTLYNNFTYDTSVNLDNFDLDNFSDKNDGYLIAGYFGGSTIDNLTVNQIGSDTTYYGIAGMDTRDSAECAGTRAIGCAALLYEQQVNVQNLTFSNSFTEIDGTPFVVSNSITFPTSITNIGDFAFALSSPSSLSLPNTLTSIGDYAFSGYNGSGLTIPSGVTKIGQNAFANYVGSSQSLVIPASVKSIGSMAFTAFAGSSVTFNEGIQSIGYESFSDYNGANVTIPSTVTTIGDRALSDMDNTKTITVNRAQAGMNLGVSWAGQATVNYSN